jgi:translation initiation factor 3 subunit A
MFVMFTEKPSQAGALHPLGFGAMQAAIAELDDLEQERSPEDIMLSYVSDRTSKDRADRELVAPWFKFLWETYRNILDILRNNVKFTSMYGMVTKQAFQFCLQYQRNTEFRRLCEILRNQLLTLRKCVPSFC